MLNIAKMLNLFNNSTIPPDLSIIIIHYSCYSLCLKCSDYLTIEDSIICGKCDKIYCKKCAKKIIRYKWHNCASFPKCICCKCHDPDTNLPNIAIKDMLNTQSYYIFVSWFEYERKRLTPIVRLVSRMVSNL